MYYELFVVIDIYSRYVVGWIVAVAETGELAEALLADCVARQGVAREQLTLHADRGTTDDVQTGRATADRPRRRA